MLNKYGEYKLSYATTLIGKRVEFNDTFNAPAVKREGKVVGVKTPRFSYGTVLEVVFKTPYGTAADCFTHTARMVRAADVIKVLEGK